MLTWINPGATSDHDDVPVSRWRDNLIDQKRSLELYDGIIWILYVATSREE